MNDMKQSKVPLAVELLMLYWSGRTVSDLSAMTALPESSILTRLCAASRSLHKSGWTVLDSEGGLGVQWEFVFFRG
jgi:hypothetical protein